ncbi:NAD(P)/FAD-dependent oxidoreductase [Agromyces larvae]|uniref:FAD-binding oxidoreductase n=1 Tax=Agromyces larvae TaxID=2929802 RepID=A0ABY4C5A5_9MICO|nr:FAD-dependent oxidoreductase [Agromyces larvae]UOE43930.1 FAD-binding oxidoreductase [Agromyces larvae]
MATTVYERRRPPASVIAHALEGSRQSVFWLDDLPAGAVGGRPKLTGRSVAELAVVGGGYTGLWTALLAKRREPDARVVVLEAKSIGWAASGRNGGFCEASLTHGRENGASRWPDEIDLLERLGRENLDAFEADLETWGIDADWERTGTLGVAVEPHQVEWLHEWAAEASARGEADEVTLLDEHAARDAIASPIVLGAVWERRTGALVHPAKLAAELARAAEALGVEIFEHSPVRAIESPGSTGAVELVTDDGRLLAKRAVLATNVFPSLLRRNRLMTVPVYDYALMTEPLSAAQLAEIGWHGRQGVSDLANQFHYLRRSGDRILFGGYDAVYHRGGLIRPEYEDRPESFERLASHFLTMFPQLEGLRFTHRWAGAIDTCTRFCAFYGTAREGRVAYAAGFTGLGVAATRFAADVMLDLLEGRENERTSLRMVRERPVPFPPEPAAGIGIDAVRRALDRADHAGGRRGPMLKLLDALGLGFDS